MEEPQPSLAAHHMKQDEPIFKMKEIPSTSTSPEHSRARSKGSRAAGQPLDSDGRHRIRRRESYVDGTRRGRSPTRSVSPQSTKHRSMRRRRSRSPSRSCSTSATDVPSSNVKRQRRSQHGQATDEHATEDTSGMTARDESRESMRSRSKRRKKYRRRSDYAATSAEIARDTALEGLRGMNIPGDRAQNTDMPSEGGIHDRTGSFESVLEEDEGVS
ncbi:hypothetical protein GJ744_006335 [Endocarpon pusillum]|uniref:Uncharacterized protein n=1 Tax=Endocarpon pusillum TaxID=364733 RepID=A0A8H7E4S2_9EURO|nr:hypothetical protein GJ744_006335 [Endocarpon pusillum]